MSIVRCLLLFNILSAPISDEFFARDDYETIMDAIQFIEIEIPWTGSSKLNRACLVDFDPFTVLVKYTHRNDGFKYVRVFRPWRTSSWMISTEDAAEDCGNASHLFNEEYDIY